MTLRRLSRIYWLPMMLTLACDQRKAESPRATGVVSDAARIAAHHDGGMAEADAAPAAIHCQDPTICIVPAMPAEDACREVQSARMRAAEAPFTRLACKEVRTASNPGGLHQQAALLEFEDEDFGIPLVLAFGSNGFTHVADLVSVEGGVGSSGSYEVERFDVLDAIPGEPPELALVLHMHAESWEDAPPGAVHKSSSRWLFLCREEARPACVRMLLSASERAERWDPLQHGRFALRMTLDGSNYRLERSSGQVPKQYRALLGQHDVAALFEALPAN